MTAEPTTVGGPRDSGQTRFLTGEAVYLDVRVARIGSRMLARLVDLIIQAVLFLVVTAVVGLVTTLLASAGVVNADVATAQTASLISVVTVLIGYPVLMETLTRGRTMGKLVVGLRVVRDDGGPITFRHALTRGLVGTAIEFPGIIGAPITWVVTLWTMVANPQGRRIGDQVAGTLVIHERTPAAWGWAPQMPLGLAGWAATLDLTGIDDDLALAVRHYLARNRTLKEPARTQLGLRLAQEIAMVTNPPAPAGAPGWAYLAAVHAERHRRAIRQLAAAQARSAAVWPDLATATATATAIASAVPAVPRSAPGTGPIRTRTDRP